MGVRILYDPEERSSVIYDSVTMTAFGIVMPADPIEIQDWLESLPDDARTMSHTDLEDRWSDWHSGRERGGGDNEF